MSAALPALQPRLGHAAAHMKRHASMMKQTLLPRQSSSSCSGSGLLYEQPAAGASIDSAEKTMIKWNPSCLDASATNEIDIYLYAPQEETANLPIHAWVHVPASQGSLDVKLAPKWWNATASVELSVNIVPTGNQPWDSANPFGPQWTATYTAPTDGSKPPDDAVVGSGENKLVSIFFKGGHITAGGKAAAIICPLIVLFVVIGLVIRKVHINRNNKTADWAEHMDKRMSQISLDWNDGGDGRAGPTPGSRPASFMGPPRPMSEVRPSLDNVRAMYNANLAAAGVSNSQTNLAGMGTSVAAEGEPRDSFARQSQYRQSRISFAPSTEMATSLGHSLRTDKGHHKNSASLPRVGVNGGYARGSSVRDSQFAVPKIDPRFKTQSQAENEGAYDEFLMSPTQEQGAHPVNVDTLRRSIDEETRKSMLAYPALEMVTNNGSDLNLPDGGRPFSTAGDSAYAPDAMVEDFDQQDDDAHENASGSHHSGGDQTVTMVQQQGQAQTSSSSQTGMLPPSNLTSPDEALRQYAAQRAAGGSSGGHASPMSGSNTMRTLYTPTSTSPLPPRSPLAGGHTTHYSIEAPSTINEDDVVGYNEMLDQQQQQQQH